MLAKIYSAAVYGVDAYEVEIEVNGAGGDPVSSSWDYPTQP
jgi:magnesium chelatase family protein